MSTLYSVVAANALPFDGHTAAIVECQTVSVEEAGTIVGVHRNTAYAAAKAGQIPTLRIGRKLRVPKAALQRLLDGEAIRGMGGRDD